MKLLSFIKVSLIALVQQLFLAVQCFVHWLEKMSQKCGENCTPCYDKIKEKLKKEQNVSSTKLRLN